MITEEAVHSPPCRDALSWGKLGAFAVLGFQEQKQWVLLDPPKGDSKLVLKDDKI